MSLCLPISNNFETYTFLNSQIYTEELLKKNMQEYHTLFFLLHTFDDIYLFYSKNSPILFHLRFLYLIVDILFLSSI